MKKIHCYCSTSFEIELIDKIDLETHPEIINLILYNKFMEYSCPSCKRLLRPEFRIELSDKNTSLTMIPEIERHSLLAGNVLLNTKQVVVGFQELRENFIIKKYLFDERIIELIKLYILEKIKSTEEVRILFSNVENQELIFHIHGLKENETGISKIPEHIYNSIDEHLKERLMDPEIMNIMALPYRSVNKISTEVQ